MEIINYIILVTLVVNLAMTVFLYILFGQSTKRIDDLSSMVNKLIMSNEESRKQLADFVAGQSGEVINAMNDVSQDIKMQMVYQKSYIENTMENNRKDMEEVKDRLDYLSTEVKID